MRKKAPLPQDIETDNTPRAFNQKQKLRRAEDALAKKDAEIRSLRFSVAALKEQVEETRVETSQDHMSYYAAEDAIKMLSEVEKANEALVKQLADLKIQSGEAAVLKKRVEVLEAAHRGMQEQIDRGNQANARLLQERKGLELRLEKYEEEFGLHGPIRTTNWLSETTVGSKRTQQRFALAAALAQLEAAELTCNAIVNGSIFSPAADT
jgi:chromosome segregation ATPase